MLPLLFALVTPHISCTVPPADLSYELLGSIKRSATSFTEGFLFDEGRLLESAGRYRDQPVVINSIDPKTGNVSVLRAAPKWNGATIFGEGLARFEEKVYQLTYDSGVAFVYDSKSWSLLTAIPMRGDLREGWGLSRYKDALVMSNGTAVLYFLEPSRLKPLRSVQAHDSLGRPYPGLNMLQVVGDDVFANVFPTDRILQIDLGTGCVIGQLDMSALWLEFTEEELGQIRGDARSNVLNGIAYDSATKTFFVTGKNWPRIFKIRIAAAPSAARHTPGPRLSR
ncbi:MAG: hypothetical protein A2X94_12405 [Bdellovibrionales bacterium GWB1_55_8]|nr:MAG: hypothetical protein A2X94_12405 [Bdellovibrionales bacterium GWB1_55_8]